MEAGGTPVVFVHGLWLHADSWGPWVDAFAQGGLLGARGRVAGRCPHGRRDPRRPRPSCGSRHRRCGCTLRTRNRQARPEADRRRPFLGGLIAQRLLSGGFASAAVAIDPAPAKGVLFLPASALRVASIALRNPGNRNGAVSLTKEQFRYGFGNALSQEESDELWERWTIPSPGKPLFEAALANLEPHSPAAVDRKSATRGPLLITAGGKDHTFPRRSAGRRRSSTASRRLSPICGPSPTGAIR